MKRRKKKRRVNICLWAQSFSKHLEHPWYKFIRHTVAVNAQVCLEFYVCAIYIKPFIRSSVCWAGRPLLRQAGRYLFVTGPAVVDLRGFLRTDPRAESLVVVSLGLSVTWCALLQELLQFLLRHVLAATSKQVKVQKNDIHYHKTQHAHSGVTIFQAVNNA